jgi:hypothetical protein
MPLPDEPQTFNVNEKTSGEYSATIVKNDGVTPLPGATLSTLALTLYVIKADGTVTLIRNHQDVLNTANVTISAGGEVLWNYQVADTTLVEDLPFERHIALFEWTAPGGVAGKHEFILRVRNLGQVV